MNRRQLLAACALGPAVAALPAPAPDPASAYWAAMGSTVERLLAAGYVFYATDVGGLDWDEWRRRNGTDQPYIALHGEEGDHG